MAAGQTAALRGGRHEATGISLPKRARGTGCAVTALVRLPTALVLCWLRLSSEQGTDYPPAQPLGDVNSKRGGEPIPPPPEPDQPLAYDTMTPISRLLQMGTSWGSCDPSFLGLL